MADSHWRGFQVVRPERLRDIKIRLTLGKNGRRQLYQRLFNSKILGILLTRKVRTKKAGELSPYCVSRHRKGCGRTLFDLGGRDTMDEHRNQYRELLIFRAKNTDYSCGNNGQTKEAEEPLGVSITLFPVVKLFPPLI